MKLFDLSIIIEFERGDKYQQGNCTRFERIIGQLKKSQFGTAKVLRVIKVSPLQPSICVVVPAFGWDYANERGQVSKSEIGYCPEYGVERHFSHSMLVSCPDQTTAHDLYGDYEMTIDVDPAESHGAKAVITVCGVEEIKQSLGKVRYLYTKATGDGHPSTYLHKQAPARNKS